MAKLEVMCARALTDAVNRLAGDFTRETGQEVDLVYGTVGALQDRLAKGETADVLILSASAIERLEQSLVSRADLVRTSIGVAVRDGAAAPDISTAEAFKRTLLEARAVAFSDASVGGSAGVYLAKLFERMGIADEIKKKALPQRSGGEVAERVARGEADIGMTLIPEILPIKGARVLGPLPAPLANDTTYCAGVAASSAARQEALAFIRTLTRPAARDVWTAAGFEPVFTPPPLRSP